MDLSEKGMLKGQPISLDRRLFMKFTAFNGCGSERDAGAPALANAAVEESRSSLKGCPLIDAAKALEDAGVEGAMYVDTNDPTGIGVMAMTEDPEFFATTLRDTFNRPPFTGMNHKGEFDMLGRTYSIGYEPDLEDTLLVKPRSKVLNPSFTWAVWYPLQRSKSFYVLPQDKQRQILAEHGSIGRRYGVAGLAADVRLACHGLDKHDNDFVIGLLGPNLFPLSAVVQEMRKTEQTSQYLDSLGPFFVGRTVWQSGNT